MRLDKLSDLNEQVDEPGFSIREATPEVEYHLLERQDIEMMDVDLPPSSSPGPSRLPELEQSNDNISDLAPAFEPTGSVPPGTLRYDAIQGVWIEDYHVPTVGMPIRAATSEELARHVNGDLGLDIGALSDPENFEIAEFLLHSGLSVAEREKFLKLQKFQGQMPWSSNFKFMQDIDKLPHKSEWHHKYYELKGSAGTDIEEFIYLDTSKALQKLFAIPSLKNEYHFRPETHYTTQSKEGQTYSNSWTGKLWRETQEMINDQYATVGQYIIATDETPLTGFCGNKKAHPVYFTIGNLPKHIRRTHSHRAMILIGYLPVPKLACEPNKDKARELKTKLFNDCMRDLLTPLSNAERTGMEVICADGWVRRIYPTLSSSIADYPEQCKHAGVIGTWCPICLVRPENRGNLDQDIPLRQKGPTLRAIIEHREDGSPDFEDFGLHDRWPWWNRHTYIDIATMHTPDLLHQIHKGVFKDHLAKWLEKELGAPTIDSRYQAMPKHHKVRHFKRGVSKLGRATGREAKEMMKTFLPAISDASPRIVEAAHALLKFSYLAHSSSLTDSELLEMDNQLAIFHQHKDVFSRFLATDRGFHNVPKFHMLQHYTHAIRMLGTTDGYNTEVPERLHIVIPKAGFEASNKVDDTELDQMTRHVQRMDALAIHRACLNYRDLSADLEDDYGSDSESDTNEDPEENLIGGCVVERVIGAVQNTVGSDASVQASSSVILVPNDRQSPEVYYPNPEIVTSKQRTKLAQVGDVIKTHGTTNLVNDLSVFLEKIDHNYANIMLSLGAELEVWTTARLYHERLPFKPLEPQKVDYVRAYPTQFDYIQRPRRRGHFDTVLVMAYPHKTGLHRYRAARVRAIFQLPQRLQRFFPHKLAYVEWFNPFSPSSVQNLHTYTTTISVDQAQRPRSAVIPLTSIRLTCHLGPKFSTIDEEVQLGLETDIFEVCRSYFFNQFGSFFTFDLFEHWSAALTFP